jgi:ABC-type xylose transport system permease subunit
VGALYGFLRNQFEMPSFVATLAGLLALLGLQLYILGPTGSINMPFTSPLVRFGQILIMPAWLSYCLAVVPGAMIVFGSMRTNTQRRAANLSASGLSVAISKAVILTFALIFAVFKMGTLDVSCRWQLRGCAAFGYQCSTYSHFGLRCLFVVCCLGRRFRSGAVSLCEPAGGDWRR